ncbi:hypothetical protein F5878DRAFT_539847 [Lentinula raphanica]|uniref:VHS domain-containing protein n=1 Tax=Lentinula raphanica TaxID=153919 RepID=A0AA38UCL3_9AGAR|nr:hypothetical protein F5880DRAFT_1666142 [Lentinula raphanica]KAJ3837194.1 hypothetical protein F5878DRAFT_539847 [Lentinula raphanica]
MSAITFARQAFNREKPHSSITDWVDILTANHIEEEAYDGIPELVDSINLQGLTGTGEASRAIRKKLKHGGPHQQYRSLVILKALVENCGDKFKTSFADGQLTDALRQIAGDRTTDKRVQKKLKLVLISWHEQFKSDPSMRSVSELYHMCRDIPTAKPTIDPMEVEANRRRAEKEEAKRKAKLEKEEARKKEEAERLKQKQMKNRPKRAPFNFEQEKPKVLASIVEASQASSNLANAITLVNPEKESLQSSERVQDCLAKAKLARKQIVRYIQLVENEEVIGVLIETNDRIISALELYDNLSSPNNTTADQVSAAAASLASTHISPESEVSKLQEKQKAAVQKAKLNGSIRHGSTGVYADLEDLNFGAIGASSSNLPPPLRPTSMSEESNGVDGRGSLSDFSDYESSDEETHNARGSSSRSAPKDYYASSDEGTHETRGLKTNASIDDPFADPFAD